MVKEQVSQVGSADMKKLESLDTEKVVEMFRYHNESTDWHCYKTADETGVMSGLIQIFDCTGLSIFSVGKIKSRKLRCRARE